MCSSSGVLAEREEQHEQKEELHKGQEVLRRNIKHGQSWADPGQRGSRTKQAGASQRHVCGGGEDEEELHDLMDVMTRWRQRNYVSPRFQGKGDGAAGH